MDHYACVAQKTNARCANENGDVESQNGHLKDRIEQALLLRGSRDFDSREDYMALVQSVVDRANAGRSKRFAEERAILGSLPAERLDTDDVAKGIRVSKSSTINVRGNTYSVPSRLIGTKVDARIAAETITVMRGDVVIQTMDRLVGKQAASINYRHVIDSLVRKPGAFADYRYREEMFPSSYFRFAYDLLKSHHTDSVADKMYLQILKLAADESQHAVEDALRKYVASGEAIVLEELRDQVASADPITPVTDIDVEPPELSDFDCLLTTFSKDGIDDDETEDHNDRACEVPQVDPETGRERKPHAAVQGTSHADVPRSVRADGDAGGGRVDGAPGLPVRTDDFGMSSQAGGSNQTPDDPVETSRGQDVGRVRLDATTDECASSAGDASRRDVPGSAGEHSPVRQTGLGQESCVVRVSGAVGAVGSEHVVHDVQPVGSTTTDRQAGSAATETNQTVLVVRGPDHRRPGLRATEPRRDGGAVHAAGRALRTGQRSADEQPSVLEVGSDLQRRDDDRRGDRPLGSSQRDHRAECAELPRGESQDAWQIHYRRGTRQELATGNSNCR